MSSNCFMCSANLHASCQHGSCDCNHLSQDTERLTSHGNDTSTIEADHSGIDEADDVANSSRSNGYGRNTDIRGNGRGSDSSTRSRGRESNLKDQQSTGRKRAAKLYPLVNEHDCEWQGRGNCGGGSRPILGCVSGKQQARHHGPDKTVSNNEQGNVHRICHYCHNRWHAANDPSYDWNNPCTTAHSPRPMGSEEFQAAIMDEMRYLGTKLTPIKD